MTNRTDTFDRAAGGTPTDGGSVIWDIASNKQYEASGQSDIDQWLESSVSDVEVQVTIDGHASTEVGILFRVNSAGNYMVARIHPTACQLYKRVSGTFTQIGSNASAGSSDAVFKVVANGTAIELFRGGVSIGSWTDSTWQTETKHGIRASGDSTTTFDDFSITAVSGSSAKPGYYFAQL
jgi:hypothetical protein